MNIVNHEEMDGDGNMWRDNIIRTWHNDAWEKHSIWISPEDSELDCFYLANFTGGRTWGVGGLKLVNGEPRQ